MLNINKNSYYILISYKYKKLNLILEKYLLINFYNKKRLKVMNWARKLKLYIKNQDIRKKIAYIKIIF